MIRLNETYTFAERILIREYYSVHPNPGNKNGLDWKMSAIENLAWNILRANFNCRNFNPEYPIGKYFADFADPIKKIVIECDSKRYNGDAAEKDYERQRVIESLGWTVYRFGSYQIYSERYKDISSRDGSFYDYDTQQQEEIDRDADICFECFINSSYFKSLYQWHSEFTRRFYNPFENDEDGIEQKDLVRKVYADLIRAVI